MTNPSALETQQRSPDIFQLFLLFWEKGMYSHAYFHDTQKLKKS
jgi:hypothetical protein